MSYERVTEGERNQIYALRQAGKGINEIARQLGRHKSTVSREVKRNTGRRGYRPRQAHRKAVERAKRPGPRRFTEEVRRDAEEKLRLGWSPEAICGRAELEGRARVCKETIYKHVYADAKAGGDLWTHLARAKRRRKRRCPRQEGRGRGVIPGRRGIETRPPEVGLRVVPGHWAGDLVAGAADPCRHVAAHLDDRPGLFDAGAHQLALHQVAGERTCNAETDERHTHQNAELGGDRQIGQLHGQSPGFWARRAGPLAE